MSLLPLKASESSPRYGLVDSTKYRGEFEERLKKIMEEIRTAKDVILVIDEFILWLGLGGEEGAIDIICLSCPSAGELQCGATTLDDSVSTLSGMQLERRSNL